MMRPALVETLSFENFDDISSAVLRLLLKGARVE